MRAPISTAGVAGVAVLAAASSALAPLEPAAGILFGPWVDTTPVPGVVPQILQDSPVSFNQRRRAASLRSGVEFAALFPFTGSN
ncbi:hypothetical protein BDK51DRAFT_44291 [Blyttiomyces helicus]|uniref:Uncharacterized protein n=1 Tax=Blyttiomyces helicus TaxID=388810 RepID=A0A4P9W0A1_9FUNG|nr:hypothetical protein BDK51DRAFT_44291 [Blyttiomyces helicus]|eukprot:RKO84745.1 hypothetical protein BDK51DRAFT_44291 [Blyttiomyces helicus]